MVSNATKCHQNEPCFWYRTCLRFVCFEPETAEAAEAMAEAAPLRIGLIGSTRGSSSQLTFDTIKKGELNVQIVVVVSNKGDAGILERGRNEGVKAVHVPCKKGTPRAEYDAQVTKVLREEGVELVMMCGFMRIVSPEFCKDWEGRCINIHPSLLPKHAGGMDLEVHKAVIDAKETESGCTVHLVTEEVDGGPVVVQRVVQVEPGETPESLKAKVQAEEGPAFIDAIRKSPFYREAVSS